VLDEDADDAPQHDNDDPTISVHALIDIQPSSGRTMQVHVVVNGATLCALLDSGSTHNFLDTDVAACIEMMLYGCAGLLVSITNDDHVSSLGCCLNLRLTVGAKPFHSDLYDIALSTYDMVLGA
jgi:hypothetical protein